MAQKIILRIFAGIFFTIFLLTFFGMILGVYNGTAKDIILFFKVIINPAAAFNNPLGTFHISVVALIQFFIIWGLFFISKKLWKNSTKDQQVIENTNDQIS